MSCVGQRLKVGLLSKSSILWHDFYLIPALSSAFRVAWGMEASLIQRQNNNIACSSDVVAIAFRAADQLQLPRDLQGCFFRDNPEP